MERENIMKIINSIKENKDEYDFAQVSCGEKVYGILLDNYNEEYSSIFYMYIKLFQAYNLGEYQNLPMDIPLEDIINDKFGLNIKEYILKNNDFFQFINNQLNMNHPVLVPGNLKKLFYSKFYQRHDRDHLFLIKGYDDKRKIYFVLDNLHINDKSAKYKEFILEYKTLKSMNEAYLNNTNNGIIYYIENNNIDLLNPFDIFLDCIVFYLNNLTEKPYKELDYLDCLINHLSIGNYYNKDLKLNHDDRGLIIFQDKHLEFEQFNKVIINSVKYKDIFFTELIKNVNKYFDDNNLLNEINILKNELIEEWNKIINKALINFYRDEKFDVSKLVDKVISYEQKMKCMVQDIKEGLLIARANRTTKLPYNTDGNIYTGIEFKTPKSRIEQKLSKIWKSVLALDRIGRNDNFFELGGHSLKAINVISKIQKEFIVELSLTDIFRKPTIQALAEYIEGLEEDICPSIEPAEKREYYPLSSAQKRMYILNQIEKEGKTYNMLLIKWLKGNIDKVKVEEVFKTLINRHESLRTGFEIVDGNPVQKIYDEVKFNIEYKEVMDRDEADEAINLFIRPFDLTKPPLFRVGLIKVSDKGYILITDMHHIVSDGVSKTVMWKEFSKLYNSEYLKPLKTQYKDYSIWQQEMVQTNKFKKQEKYWLEKFKENIPMLNMPIDYLRSSVQSFEGDTVRFIIDNELTIKIHKLAYDSGATLFMILLAAYNVLLYKYTGQEDIVVGTPTTGRVHIDIQDIVGMFVNTLAIRNGPKADKTFKDFLLEVKENALGAYENQDYQFEELVDKLKIERDMSRNPIFDTMLTMQNIEFDDIEVKDLEINDYEYENKTSKFDLSMNVEEVGEEINFEIEYKTKLFKRRTIERLGNHFIKILKEITKNPKAKLNEIEIVTDQEKKEILFDFNDTNVEYPKDKTIHKLFEEQVEKTPENVAVAFKNKEMTYKELNERANQLARILREKGVKQGTIVGIMIERSIDMVVGLLGILKAGGVYLPLDLDYPINHIKNILEDSNTKILLTQEHLMNNIEFNGVFINIEDEDIYNSDKSNLFSLSKSNDLAYIIYTSGSTGKPKGVMVEHQGLANYIWWASKEYLKSEKMSFPLFTSIAFDLTVTSIFIPIITGNTIIIYKGEKGKSLVEEIIQENKVGIVKLTPSHLKMISNKKQKNSSIKRFILGGEVLDTKLAKLVYNNFERKIEIYNEYGPTETVVGCTSYKFNSNKNTRKSVPIGMPADNVQIYILDKYQNLVPIGVVGEIYISGDGLARGYLNRYELTKEKFVKNPFNLRQRMYRTGDLARWLEDGNIEFLGRIDHQVKIRGYRIEVGEIEKRLLEHNDIKDVAVIETEDTNEEKYLCGYIVAEKELTISELRDYLCKELPDYMIPSYFVQIEKIPLTASGKIDRKALPKIDGNIEIGTVYEAPSNEIEEKLVDIWQEVLGINKIGTKDNFFKLGGHSLKAIALTTKIGKVFNKDITLLHIFKAPTVKGLAEVIEVAEEMKREVITSFEKEYCEASLEQRRIFALNQFNNSEAINNMPSIRIIDGKIDVKRFKTVFEMLLERHEALRTSFEYIDEKVKRCIHKEVTFDIPYSEFEEGREEKIIKEFTKTIDLGRAPLLRVELIKLTENKNVVLFDIHKILFDEISMEMLWHEFLELYKGNKFAELKVHFVDFSTFKDNLLKNNLHKNFKKI